MCRYHVTGMRYFILLYKVECFIELYATDENDNLTCEIIYGNFTCDDYH